MNFIAQNANSKREVFNFIKAQKESMTPAMLVGLDKQSRSSCIFEFATEVFNLDFDQTPDYNKLKVILASLLASKNMRIDFNFDWTTNYNNSFGPSMADHTEYYLSLGQHFNNIF